MRFFKHIISEKYIRILLAYSGISGAAHFTRGATHIIRWQRYIDGESFAVFIFCDDTLLLN
jgi:hypothetical protein